MFKAVYRMVFVGALLVCTSSYADVPATQKAEVEHLLDFVTSTQCLFNRNGSDHKGSEAAAHMKKKYHYFQDGIASTEDFIRLSATKSTMSGKYYTVKCPKQQAQKARDWLLAELKRYRDSHKPS